MRLSPAWRWWDEPPILRRSVIARHAVPKQSRATRASLDCFVASLLAMTALLPRRPGRVNCVPICLSPLSENAMAYVTEQNLTDVVLERWQEIPDPRLRQIMQA